MFRIKKLDIFISKQFALLFTGTFCISLFVLMMQFLWRYVDELIGKGLSLEVLAQFFWYMALMMVPQAFPLAILLSSLITFGNLGESSELTAIKAAGISLMQAFRSLIFICVMITIGSFYFQNAIGPTANQKLAQLLLAMKQKSPELEIPEGIFYDGIPDCNLYVQKKDVGTGMLYGVMIYRMTGSYEDAAIILADSGRLQSTADKKHLLLSLYSGEWFENMKSQDMIGNANVPYRRETFVGKQILLDFDDGLNVDDNAFTGNARGKGLKELAEGIVRINHDLDSIGKNTKQDLVNQYFSTYGMTKKDTIAGRKIAQTMNTDTIFARLSADKKKRTMTDAVSEVRMANDYIAFSSLMSQEGARGIREHNLEKINKFTTALLCLVFFFIGAPLGAIIRKGGLGLPVIISVFVYIVFYILDNTGFRMARLGACTVWQGKIIAPLVLVPTAIFFTYKANKDSMVFNLDLWRTAMLRLLGLRLKRSVAMKEVIIYEPDYSRDVERLAGITEDITTYAHEHHLMLAPNIKKVFFKYVPDHEIERINAEMEEVIEDLTNTRDRDIMKLLKQYPVLSEKAHTRPFDRKWMNVTAFFVFPVGIFLYLRMWRFRLRLLHDLRQIRSLNEAMIERVKSVTVG